ncbi:MAG: hypothetical protein M3R54_01730 [Chloroflexota bacterium]|nr:hypothetical protein [Chloroflexota bacterium]
MLPQEREIDLSVQLEDRRAQRAEAVAVERAREDDVDASRPAREESLEGRD